MTRRAVGAWLGAVAAVVAGPACQKKETIVTPALSATCEARPSSGEAPLSVSFALNVAGAEGPFTVSISYGDGASGTNADLPHTYASAGSYTASFDLATATQSARCSTAVTVTTAAPPAANRPPSAVFHSNPDAVKGQITGKAPLDVLFNMCQSTDPDHDVMFFRMDFDGDGNWEVHGTTGGSCRRDNTYAQGTYTAVNCVTDLGPDAQPLHAYQCRSYTVVATP
jgi:PKD repeat protein